MRCGAPFAAVIFLILALICVTAALDVGVTWPTGTTEEETSRTIKQYIKPFSAEYNALTVNTNSDISFADGANRMSARLSEHLDLLAAQVVAKLSHTRLHVTLAYQAPPPAGQPSTSLHHEARAADLSLVAATPGATVTPANYRRLGDFAVAVRFDHVQLTRADLLEVSVIPDKCTKSVDLAFLLDGSASIAAEDFEKAKNFVSEVTSYFDVGPGKTQVSVSTFSGFSGHISTIAGLPDCPKGTHFEVGGQGCICAPKATCDGPKHSQAGGVVRVPGCREGMLSSGGAIAYYSHDCATCKCVGAQWPNSESVVTNFDFNDIEMSQGSIVQAMMAVEFPQGGTQTSLGLQHVRKNIFNADNGMRPAGEGVPRVLVVLTDGMANDGFAPKKEAALLRAEDNVKIFAIGVSNYNLQELRDMASAPADEHIMLLQSFSEIVGIVNRMGAISCDETAIVDLEKDTDTEVELGTFLYFQPTVCDDVSADVTVTLSGPAGSSTHLFMSWSQANPGPLNADRMDESAASVKTMVLAREGHLHDHIYLAVYGVGLKANQFTLKVSCDASTTSTTTTVITSTTGTGPAHSTTTAAPTSAQTTSRAAAGDNLLEASGDITTAGPAASGGAPVAAVAGGVVGLIALIALVMLALLYRRRGKGSVTAIDLHDASMYNNPLYRRAEDDGTTFHSRDNLLDSGVPAVMYSGAASTAPPLPRMQGNTAYDASYGGEEEQVYASLATAQPADNVVASEYDSMATMGGSPGYTPMSSVRYGNLEAGAEAPMYDTPSNTPASSTNC